MVSDPATTYERYAPLVLRRCRALLRDESAALDAMQDTFVQYLAHQSRLRSTALSSFFFQTATHVCLNRLRSRRRNPAEADEELLLQIASLDDLELRTEAEHLLARLFHPEPASTRVIAVLHLLDGLTLEETAEAVGLSVSGVRRRLRVLRARLDALTQETA